MKAGQDRASLRSSPGRHCGQDRMPRKSEAICPLPDRGPRIRPWRRSAWCLPVAAAAVADAHREPVGPVGGEHQNPLGVAARAVMVTVPMPRTVAVVIVPVTVVVVAMPLAAMGDLRETGLVVLCRGLGG